MELENIRIIKDMRNSANRQSNCDSANINKMVRTAARQVDDIRYIEEHFGFEQLPPQLREMAQVRLENPGCITAGTGNISGSAGWKIRCESQTKEVERNSRKLESREGEIKMDKKKLLFIFNPKSERVRFEISCWQLWILSLKVDMK